MSVMPPWKGWNEDEVRITPVTTPQRSRSEHGFATAGFTAINAPHRSRAGNVWIADHSTSKSQTAVHTGLSPSDHEEPKSVASGFLGRSGDQNTALQRKQSTGPITRPDSKHSAGKGKKRARPANNKQAAKRCRISLEAHETDSIESENRNQTSNVLGGTVTNTNLTTPAGVKAHAIPVYMASTSMEDLHSSPPKTSLEAIRSCAGQGAIIYTGQTASRNCNGVVQRDSLWSSHPAALRSNVDVTVDGGVSSSSKGRIAGSKAPQQVMPTLQCSRVAGRSQPSGTNSYKAAATKQELRDIADTCNATFPAEDEFGGDDNEMLSEVLDLVDRMEAKSKMNRNLPSLEAPRSQLSINTQSVLCQESPSEDRRISNQDPMSFPDQEDEFLHLGDVDEIEMLEITTTVERATMRSLPLPQALNSNQGMHMAEQDCSRGGPLSDADGRLLDNNSGATQGTKIEPVVRKPFPAPILDQSTIFGATSVNILRTCFRIGEVLNVGSEAVRTKQHVLLELYARVTFSYRENKASGRQHFLFKDLYHDHPPHIEATFQRWRESQLWNQDSKAFLTPKQGGSMCRAIAKIERGADRGKWRLELLSIWEATWEDVDWTASIFANDMKPPNKEGPST